MERSSEYQDLAAALAELRPTPRAEFAAELDQRVVAGFPRGSRLGDTPLTGLAKRIRGLTPQRLLFGGGIAALAAIAVATVVVTSVDSGSGPVAMEQPLGIERRAPEPLLPFSREIPKTSNQASESSAASSGGASATR